MVEERIVDVERRLVGRIPFKYGLSKNTKTLEADSGFGRVGAKMDPRTGALMYDRFEDWITKERVIKEEIEKANIRFSDDSGAMIEFREEEKVLLGIDGAVRSHDARGHLSILNRSEKDRIWDIKVGLQEEMGLAKLDSDSFDAKEVDPSKKVTKEYTIALHEPSMVLEEVISTHPDLPETRVLLMGRTSHAVLQIGMKNLAIIPYKDVKLVKPLPADFKNIIFPGDTSEDVALEDGKLIWRIKELEPGEMRALRYETDISPRSADKVPTGDIKLTATGEEVITSIVVNSFDAMCRNMYFIEADETDEPGVWQCRFVVENTSRFEVELIRAEVKDPKTNKVYLNMDRPSVYIPPQGRWESEPWIVDGTERPAFVKNLILNVVPALSKKVDFELVKEGGDFFPASISFKKTFDKPRVEARRDTDITAMLVIENTGCADIDQVFIRDSLPDHLLTPSTETITVEKGGVPVEENLAVNVEPVEAGTGDQRFYIRIDDLSSHAGPLKKGEKLVVKYKTVVHRPEPDTKIVAPAEIDARTAAPGPVIYGEDTAGAPVIDTLQILRRFSVGKSIEQGASPGEYRIELLYRNRGNDPILALTLRDMVPENFKGMNYSLAPSSQETTSDGMVLLEWAIEKVQPGQSLVISYSLKGEGEFHPSDAQIFYNA